MSYTYKIENLDCANCAAQLESAVSKIGGIKSCSVNFFALKMKIETDAEITDELYKKIQKTVKRAGSGARIAAV